VAEKSIQDKDGKSSQIELDPMPLDAVAVGTTMLTATVVPYKLSCGHELLLEVFTIPNEFYGKCPTCKEAYEVKIS
jgi:hypothetical protein